MKSLMLYKGYYGSCEISVEDDCLFGKIEYIRDLISYEGTTVSEIKKAFHEAVDEYLEDCEKLGREPSKPFKGSFNIRIGEELHRKTVLSLKDGESLNSFVKSAIELKLAKGKAS